MKHGRRSSRFRFIRFVTTVAIMTSRKLRPERHIRNVKRSDVANQGIEVRSLRMA
jgi:hypothetical protein